MIEVEAGKIVSISLSNGQLIGGVVEKWSTENIILKQPQGAGITIITRPERDVVFVHILEDKKENITEAHRNWQELVESPPTMEKPKKLAELKVLMAQTEKEIIANKLSTHSIGEVRTVTYGTPKFLKKPSAE
jgi:hypothetical protein